VSKALTVQAKHQLAVEMLRLLDGEGVLACTSVVPTLLHINCERTMMLRNLVVLGLGSFLLAGCGRTLPLISHAHVGHSLTTWRDTPDERGLFVVAEQETTIALQQAQAAQQTRATVARQHLAGVIHALDPERQATGPGLGYGGIRALAGAAQHIEFASTSDDASRNIVKGAEAFVKQAAVVIENLRLAVDVAILAQKSSDAEISGLTAEIAPIIDRSLNGADVDGNGSIGNTAEEIGLKQMRQQLLAMLSRENPPYHPIGRRYLLGLVRMPNGRWVYQFQRSGGSSSPRY
jgi:hypothetical protein